MNVSPAGVDRMTWIERMLVDDWRTGWKWFSVYGMGAIAMLPELYSNADFLQYLLTEAQFRHVMASLGLLALISRFVKQ